MRHYETTIIIPPNIGEEAVEETINAVEKELTERFDGENISVNRWGKKPLAYQIKKFNEGYYALYEYDSKSESTISGLEARLRLNENVIRFLTVRRDEEMKSEARMKERYAKKRKMNENREETHVAPRDDDDDDE